ncbi:hypothetical protein [Candidatus Amarolinea aalborgensis]|uniref:hypothetical protein n=1 Tax=Candidatus Amarolinea aalborgensis TaxID=2249329 RepID=UPI003BFA2BBE
MTLRTTIYLDEAVISQLRRFIPQRGLSQLVNDLLQQKVMELERAEIEAQMVEGYLAVREERVALNEDWQRLDGEGWPA